MDKNIAKQNLLEVQKIFRESGVICFLAYGSCLGMIREGDIMKHDLDTDVGILAEDWNFDFLRQFTSAGFKIMNIFGMFNYGCEIALSKNGIKTDVMFFYKDKDRVWNALWKNGCKNGQDDMIRHIYPKELFESVKEITDKELNNYLVLAKTEKYLETVYGKDWRIPVKKWDWKTDHKCIENEQ
jgi:hypothetical protein